MNQEGANGLKENIVTLQKCLTRISYVMPYLRAYFRWSDERNASGKI